MLASVTPPTLYVYAWGPRWKGHPGAFGNRQGQLCRVVARGGRNSAMVEFEDGYLAVISRNALRRPKGK